MHNSHGDIEHKFILKVIIREYLWIRSCYHSNRKVDHRPARESGGDPPTLIKTKPSPPNPIQTKGRQVCGGARWSLTASGHIWRRIWERTGAHASPSGSIWKLHTGPVHCPLEIKKRGEKREPEPWFSSQPERGFLHDVIPVDSAVGKPSGLTCPGAR